ncbi:unnamed protein product [Amoebophrya sp. A120]|nr:unnamed protein product [Amoebophrya sp. A120]|eukprot:GSA120T00014127001.1
MPSARGTGDPAVVRQMPPPQSSRSSRTPMPESARSSRATPRVTETGPMPNEYHEEGMHLHAAPPLQRSYSSGAMTRCDRLPTHTIKGIPGYRGYLPGVKAETIGEGLFSNVLYESQHATKRKGHAQQHYLLDRDTDRAVRNLDYEPMPERYPTKEEILKKLDNKRGDDDMATGWVPTAGDYRESRVLDSHECYYEEPPMDNVLKAKTNIVGYTGHIPGRESENVFANTWSRTNMNATAAFYRTFRGRNRNERNDPLALTKGRSRLFPRGVYDMNQNQGGKLLFTKERTVVGRNESDSKPEIPMFSSSYQDKRRGWSLDPWVGKQIDPAGREEPFSRQESYGCIPPFAAPRAPGYTGFVPGKVGENVVGERQTIADAVCFHRTMKNKSEKLQR